MSLKVKSKDEILSMGDEELRLWIKRLCGGIVPIKYLKEIDTKTIRDYISKYYTKYDPRLIVPRLMVQSGLKLPYDADYGISKSLKLLSSFQNFLNDEETILRTIITIAQIHSTPITSSYILKELLNNLPLVKTSICSSSMWLFSYNEKQLKSNKVKDSVSLEKDEIIYTTTVPNYITDAQQHSLRYMQFEWLRDLNICYKDKETEMIKVNLVTYTSKTSDEKGYFNFENKTEYIHATQFIINKKSKKIVYLDSALRPEKSKYNVDDSLLHELYNLLGERFEILSYEEEECPRFDIQGETDLCTIYSLFISTLYFLNGNRKKIYDFLLYIGPIYREKLIAQFLFYLYNTLSRLNLTLYNGKLNNMKIPNFINLYNH
jgi:hypothetical protein